MIKRKYIFTFFIISLCVRNSIQAMNPLHDAIDREDTARVSRLIEGRADVNRCDNRNMTPLDLAIDKGNGDIVKTLLAHHADPQITNNGLKSLHYAARKGYKDVVQALLDHRLDPNQTDNNGLKPLHHALLKNRGDVAELLLRYVPDPQTLRFQQQELKNKYQRDTLEKLIRQEIKRRFDELTTPPAWASKAIASKAIDSLAELVIERRPVRAFISPPSEDEDEDLLAPLDWKKATKGFLYDVADEITHEADREICNIKLDA